MYKGKLLANVYYSNFLFVIDVVEGEVLKEIDLTSLVREVENEMNDKEYKNKGNVLNGIAYHEDSDTLLVTGKFWPFIYLI